MTIQYVTTKDDLIYYYKYIASKSARITKQRKKGRFRIPVLYLLGAASLAYLSLYGGAAILLLLAVLWALLYPLWVRKHYEKHYKEVVKESAHSSEPVTAIFNSNDIFLQQGTAESKIPTSLIDWISETADYFIIKLQGNSGIYIPKREIENIELLRETLRYIAKQEKANYNSDHNWKWQ
jgi:hypothetical protein